MLSHLRKMITVNNEISTLVFLLHFIILVEKRGDEMEASTLAVTRGRKARRSYLKIDIEIQYHFRIVYCVPYLIYISIFEQTDRYRTKLE